MNRLFYIRNSGGVHPSRKRSLAAMSLTTSSRHSCLRIVVPLLLAISPAAFEAASQHGSGGTHAPAPFALDIYALRGPQDTSATLYISVLPADPQTAAPETLKDVLIRVTGTNGVPESTRDYRDVTSPGGRATIDLGDVPLLDAIDVEVLAQTDQTLATQVLRNVTAVTEFALNPRQVVVGDFEGFGAQMNQNLYTSLSNPVNGWINVPPEEVSNVEAKIQAMKPGLCRIFLSPNNYLPGNENLMPSFYQTIELAEAAGAQVNVTWWFLTRAAKPANQQATTDRDMQNFASTLIDLVKNKRLTSIRQITIQNEAGTVSWITSNMQIYEYAYRQLDGYLRDAGIRDQIKFVGGDLVLDGQVPFFTYMAQHMDDVLDGWSVHIYWNYWDPGYMLYRLNGILAVMTTLESSGLNTKPLSVTEYGVRGIKTLNGSPIKDVNPYRNGALTNTLAGYYQNADGTITPISETNIAAFEQAQFNMQAVDDGFMGLSKWDFYRAQYDFSYQDHSLIGYLFNPAAGQDRWPLRPAYYMEWLMANTTGQHWQALGYHGSAGTKLITPFRSPSGALTVLALNTSGDAASFSVGDLPSHTTFNMLVWNADGSGKVTSGGAIDSGVSGSIHVDTPAQGLVALTTVAVVPPR